MSKREEKVILNPSEVATPGRTEVDLHSGSILVDQKGIDWGDQEIEAFMSKGVMGSKPIDFAWPNRIIAIPMLIGATGDFDAARLSLQAEVGRINEEGGWLKRELIGGSYGEAGGHLFADVVKATLKLGDETVQASEGFDPNAELILETLPDFYGDEIVEAAHEFIGDGSFTMKPKGDLPARVTNMKVEDLSGNDQLGLMWHYRRRHYSSAATAAWAYEAEALTPLDAAAEVELAGASGSKAVLHNNLSTSWTPFLLTNPRSGGSLAHAGLYNVRARVYTKSTTLPWLRLCYGVGDTVSPQENRQVQIPGANAFYILELGQLNISPGAFGTARWEGVLQARGEAGGENIYVDRLYLSCADESSGILTATPSFQDPLLGYKARDEFNQAEGNLNEQPLSASGIASGPKAPGTVEDKTGIGTVAWSNPSNAKTSDNTYATVAASGTTHYLFAKKLGFAIPEGATITGIVATVERNSVGIVEDASVKLAKAGAITGSERAAGGHWPGSDGVASYGSTTDLWGTTWTPAQINAEGFGLAIAASVVGGLPPSEARVDAITVTVYYTEAATSKWVTSGNAKDLEVIKASHAVERKEFSDANINTGRYAIAGTSTYTNVIAGITCKREASAPGAGEEIRQGAIIRWTDAENWLMGAFDWVNTSGSGEDSIRVLKRKAGAVTELLKIPITADTNWRSVWIEADTHGRVMVWARLQENESPQLLGVAYDTDLATGGTLASGKVGFYDAKTGAVENARWYDSFVAWVPSHDAVMFAGKAAYLLTDGMERVSEDGNGVGKVARPGADLPRLPVSGTEETPVEIALKPSRGDFGRLPDAGLDKVKVQVSYRPCWAGVPGA